MYICTCTWLATAVLVLLFLVLNLVVLYYASATAVLLRSEFSSSTSRDLRHFYSWGLPTVLSRYPGKCTL
jgi:hypothetical protein